MTLRTGLFLTTLIGGLLTAAASAGDVARVSASERYEKGFLHRFVFGEGYRELWSSAIELPVLDLENEAGGLTPTRRFGGLQTAVLGFKGADGRTYTFRSTDKDPSAVLDPLLRDTVVQDIVQDQMAAQHPGGPQAVGVLSDAAGILTIRERMVVIPDDPALGEFREEFAGLVGSFFEYPLPAVGEHPGFHSATSIIDNKELYERLSADSTTVVDVEAFLRARLFDLLIGDFDRHRKQWRWAKLPGSAGLQPIPEDRDMAFSRFDGAGLRAGSLYIPILQNYGPEYPSMRGLALHGWEQDRWLLAALSWEQWQRVAANLRARLGDDVIDRAVAALPPDYAAQDGDRLRMDLRGRRDRLPEAARSFYEYLAGEVDVRTSDASERIAVERTAAGDLTVSVSSIDADPGDPKLFQRTFLESETKDVRIYLGDGADEVGIEGPPGKIQLRVIGGGPAPQRVDDSAGGGTRIYDSAGSVSVKQGAKTKVRRRAYTAPDSSAGFVDVDNVPPRDWGSEIIPIPQIGFEDDVGVFIGAGAIYTRYGFRKHPWSSKHSFNVGYATAANTGRGRYNGKFRPENSDIVGQLDVVLSGIEVLRFYGFGNKTQDDDNQSFFRVNNEQYSFAPSVRVPFFDDKLHITGGVEVEFSDTDSGTRFIDTIPNLYGAGNFGRVGARVNVNYDTRKTVYEVPPSLALPFHENPAAGYPTSGFVFDLTAEVTPEIWDVVETYGSFEGSIAAFFSPDDNGRIVLGLRGGGKVTIGQTPFFDLASIGGGRTFSGTPSVRGFRTERFSADSSAYGNADLRVMIGRAKIIVPGDFGIQGFYDVGRVFQDTVRSRDWHTSAGGGVWFSPLARTNTISLSAARSTEETLIYIRIGFHY